jgi:hypothetical protein
LPSDLRGAAQTGERRLSSDTRRRGKSGIPSLQALPARSIWPKGRGVNTAVAANRSAVARIPARVGARDWTAAAADLDRRGWTILDGLLTAGECAVLADLYSEDSRFRSRVEMARHGFGSGAYKYFAYPLPATVAELRASLYRRLSPVADRWNQAMRIPIRYPDTLDEYLELCHAAGQKRPTPLLLRYGPGDYNRLHQDLYGDHVFPIQVTVLLSQPGEDFAGGEFLLTEQRPRTQSRATVVPLRRGDAVAFAVNDRPVEGRRGFYRVKMRHGVSELRSGERHTLGVIFHDAK